MKKILLTMLILITLTSVSLWKMKKPYNGEQAIADAIEKSENEMKDFAAEVQVEMADVLKKYSQDIFAMTVNLTFAQLPEGTMDKACPFSDYKIDDLMKSIKLEDAYKQAKEVDFSNKRKVKKAIRYMEEEGHKALSTAKALASRMEPSLKECHEGLTKITNDLATKE